MTQRLIAADARFHPVADLFPPMTDAEYRELVEDIREHGQREPVTVDDEGRVIDGRHRVKACAELGRSVECETYNGEEATFSDFVWSENLKRRHLTSSQLACCAVDREKYEAAFRARIEKTKAAAKKKQRQQGPRGKEGGRGKKKTHRQTIAEGLGTPDDHKTDTTLARAAGTNRTTLQGARELQKKDPEKFEEVKAGTKSVSQAQREVRKEEATKRVAELPSDKYRVLYADPPWSYGNQAMPRIIRPGDLVKRERESQSLTQQELADRLEMSRPELSNIEKGKDPGALHAVRLSVYFEMPLEQFFPEMIRFKKRVEKRRYRVALAAAK